MTASRQRRVAVDHARDLGVAALERADVDELLDQLGRLRADDVAAEQLAVLLLADDLDQAGAVAVDRARADRAVLDLADDDVVARPRAPAPRSARSEATFGVQNVARGMSMYSIGCVSSPAASSTAMMPSSEALWASAGPGTRSPIAQTPLARGAQRAVDLDQAVLVELDARLVEPEALDVGRRGRRR